MHSVEQNEFATTDAMPSRPANSPRPQKNPPRAGARNRAARAEVAPASGEARDGVAAVDRALLIASTLERHTAPMTLADLSRATGLYKSTILRLMASLERASLVIRRADQSYVLGHLAQRLGWAYEATHQHREAVYPVLEWLVGQGSESASFHVIHDPNHRLCMFRIDSNHPTLDSIDAGDLLPMDRGAPAKVLRELPSANLAHTSFGEREASCAAVSAPVYAADGSVAGAISLSGPSERFTPSAVKHMTKLILQATRRATEAMGGQWSGQTDAAARRV